MDKDFDMWNIRKKRVNIKQQAKYHERDIWWCSVGLNIGREQDGKGGEFQRPVLVLKGLSKDTCLVAPITTSKQTHPLRIPLGNIKNKTVSAVISQIKVVDTRRFTEKIAVLDKEIFQKTRNSVRDML